MWSLLAAAAAAAPQVPPEIASDADFRCLAVVSVVLDRTPKQTAEDFKDVAGLTAVFMYYLGRIDVRYLELDFPAAFKSLDDDPNFATKFASEATRCGDEAQARGQWLQNMGRTLQAQPRRLPRESGGKIG